MIMFPGMNPAQMQKMMKQMGMQSKEIDAIEVVIKTSDDKEIIIKGPQVSKIKVMGQETFQITGGEITEEDSVDSVEVSEDDVMLVMEKSGASEEDARNALEKADGDIAQAIMDLVSDSE